LSASRTRSHSAHNAKKVADAPSSEPLRPFSSIALASACIREAPKLPPCLERVRSTWRRRRLFCQCRLERCQLARNLSDEHVHKVAQQILARVAQILNGVLNLGTLTSRPRTYRLTACR
jgi:hypothetical protein